MGRARGRDGAERREGGARGRRHAARVAVEAGGITPTFCAGRLAVTTRYRRRFRVVRSLSPLPSPLVPRATHATATRSRPRPVSRTVPPRFGRATRAPLGACSPARASYEERSQRARRFAEDARLLQGEQDARNGEEASASSCRRCAQGSGRARGGFESSRKPVECRSILLASSRTPARFLAACLAPAGQFLADPTPPHPRHGDEIAVAGEFLHTHVSNKVIQWSTPADLTRTIPTRLFRRRRARRCSPGRRARRRPVPVPRHGTRRIGGPNGELVTSAADLERALTQLVVHYDGCERSRDCFRVLHDERGLSCHFLIDADGRVYQTLDVIERAWHATSANDASVGVELAHEGAFVEGEAPFDENAPGVVRGDVNGKSLAQRPFTDAQYESLARLAATLIARFPLMTNEHPMEDVEDGDAQFQSAAASNPGSPHPPPRKLSDTLLRRHRGVLGHYHVQSNKSDPGPAFDWERFRRRTSALLDGAGETERSKRAAPRREFSGRADGAAGDADLASHAGEPRRERARRRSPRRPSPSGTKRHREATERAATQSDSERSGARVTNGRGILGAKTPTRTRRTRDARIDRALLSWRVHFS